jgi:hypothetical protein
MWNTLYVVGGYLNRRNGVSKKVEGGSVFFLLFLKLQGGYILTL